MTLWLSWMIRWFKIGFVVFVICISGHFGVQEDKATFASTNTRSDPEHPAGGQLEDHRGGDGRHLQEAAHPQQQGEQLGFQNKQGRRGGFGQGRWEDQETNEDAAREAKSSHRSWRYQLLLALAKTRTAERWAVYIVQPIKKGFTFVPLSILAESRPDPDGERSERGRSSSHEEEVLSQRGHHDKRVSFLS